MRVAIEERGWALRTPLRAAWGTIERRQVLLLRVEAGDGAEGTGEAAPVPGYDRVHPARVRQALERHAEVLRAGAGRPGAALLDACRDADPTPWALAAVDTALWDLAGRREGRPVASLLAERPAAAVAVNATVGAEEPEAAAAAAREAARAGFAAVKVKAGTGDDVARATAVRSAVGDTVELRLDANGAWSVDEAEAALRRLQPLGVEWCEEPVSGLAAVRELRARRPAVRVAIDETAAEPGALTGGVADVVCLKLGRCGGISGLLAAASLVRATGGEVVVQSAFDGPVGVAAAVHAAAALGDLPACGLATLAVFEGVDPGPLAVRRGAIAVPDAPGLGVVFGGGGGA